MLHNLTVKSTSYILNTLVQQTGKVVEMKDLVQDIPDDIEEQEKILQVCSPTKFIQRLYINIWIKTCLPAFRHTLHTH